MKNKSKSSGLKEVNGVIVSQDLPKKAGNTLKLPAKIDADGAVKEWESGIASPDTLIALDLFAGGGGMSLGMEDAGFFVAAGIDRDESAVATHAANFLSKSVVTDLTEVESPGEFIRDLGIPKVDLIMGGPPCQGFSRVGRGKLKSLQLQEYYDDVINSMYREFIRFVEELRPSVFVMENVPDMASFNGGALITRILDKFRSIGYRADYRVLDASYYGVPQKRRRLFVIGNLFNEPIPYPAPFLFNREVLTLRDAIGDLPARKPPVIDEEVEYTANTENEYQKLMRSRMPQGAEDVVYDHLIRAVREDDRIIFALMEEGDKYSDIPEEYQRYRSDIFKDKYCKMIWDEPSWTVTAHIRKDAYRYIHPDRSQGRMLSIREFARVQSFPDHFRFCGAPTRRMQQIGNAVPPLLAQSIGEELVKQIRQNRVSDLISKGN